MREQPVLSDVLKNMTFEGFLMVKAAQQKTAASGGKYLDLTLMDISGEVNAKMWDGSVEAPKMGEVIKVRAVMQEYNNHQQLRIDKLRSATEADEVNMQRLIPCAPRTADEMMDQITNRIDKMRNTELRELLLKRLDEVGDKLISSPAALKLHHAERSGLLNHTSTMLKGADMISEMYPFLDSDLLAAGVILHDLCKTDEMYCQIEGMATDYTAEGNLVGHIVMGVSEISRCGKELGTSQELLLMLEHMILAHHDLPEYGSPKAPMFPEAEALHTLDLLDARMYEMKREIEKVTPGSFTDRIWSLDRKLYRRKNVSEK